MKTPFFTDSVSTILQLVVAFEPMDEILKCGLAGVKRHHC